MSGAYPCLSGGGAFSFPAALIWSLWSDICLCLASLAYARANLSSFSGSYGHSLFVLVGLVVEVSSLAVWDGSLCDRQYFCNAWLGFAVAFEGVYHTPALSQCGWLQYAMYVGCPLAGTVAGVCT